MELKLKPAIGVIGGLGPQASALLYRLLIDRAPLHTNLKDTSDYPRIVLLSTSLPNYLSTGEATDPEIFNAVVAYVRQETKLLETCGAIVNCVACNTAHLALEHLRAVTTVPFLSIMDLVRERVKGFARPGLLSTKLTVQAGLYANVHPGLYIPPEEALEEAETYIFRLLDGNITPEDGRAFRSFTADFKQKNNLDAVILGCTELPVIYGGTEDASVISSLEVLADGLLAYYYAHITD